MEIVIFPGEKIGAWAAWSIQARADIKEAHVEPIEVKATEEASVGKAALGKEATYEQRVEAWIERFGTKADGKKATNKTAKKKAVQRKETIEESSLKKIVFIRGETIEGSSPMMKAAPRDEIIEESPLTRTKAVSKGSLEIEEGGPTDQVLDIEEGAIEQVQASKRSSHGGRPCHQTDGSTRANSSLRHRLGHVSTACPAEVSKGCSSRNRQDPACRLSLIHGSSRGTR